MKCQKTLTNKAGLFDITFAIVAAGVILRLYFFFLKRSLWLDEVYLSTGIINNSFTELLTKPLPFYQKAPLGFLMAEKSVIGLFTANEFTLRLFPLLCAIAALLMFVPVARFFLNKNMVWLAVAIFALAPPLIYHSAEAKQYSTELLATVLVIYFFIKTLAGKLKVVWLALAGAVLIWFSYPVVFILAGVGLFLFFKALKERNINLLVSCCLVILIWVVSFGINYFGFTHKHVESQWTLFWFDYYGFFMPSSVKGLEWLPTRLYRMLDYPLGLWWNFFKTGNDILQPLSTLAFVPAALFIAGFYFYVLKDRLLLLFFLSPVVLMLAASMLHLYPVSERFWVFIAPLFILIIAKGWELVSGKIKNRAVKIIIPLLLLTGPVVNDIILILHQDRFMKQKNSSQRQALDLVQQHYKPGDIVYVYWNANAGYNLYTRLYNYTFPAIRGKDYRFESNNYNEYFNKLKNDTGPPEGKKRIWLIFNYTFQSDIGEGIDVPSWYFNTQKPTDNVVNMFAQQGRQVLSYKKFDTHVYCFEIKH